VAVAGVVGVGVDVHALVHTAAYWGHSVEVGRLVLPSYFESWIAQPDPLILPTSSGMTGIVVKASWFNVRVVNYRP